MPFVLDCVKLKVGVERKRLTRNLELRSKLELFVVELSVIGL